MPVEVERGGVYVGAFALEVRLGGDVVSANTEEEDGEGEEDDKAVRVVDFAVSNGLGFPELAGGVVPFAVFLVFGELVGHVNF